MHSSTRSLFLALCASAAVLAVPASVNPRTQSTNYTGVDCNDGDYEASLPKIVPVNTRANNEELIKSLTTAATARDRSNLLNQPGDFIFDFANPVEGSVTTGGGGRVVASNRKTFPALIGNGASVSIGFLGPCGLNTPHVHPRATELNLIVEGRLVVNFQEENGVPTKEGLMETFQMAVFPQGSIHTEFNPDCGNATFVAGFSSEDPGVEQVAQTFFNLRPDIVQATLGGVSMIDGKDLESFREVIPANVAAGVEGCLKKCGLKKNKKRDIFT